jgi:hypothetical protein
MSDDATALRRAADRERKRASRAAARIAREAEQPGRACAQGTSVSEIDLSTLDGIRAVLVYALEQVQSDRTNSPTNRARVAAQIAREASALLQVHTLADRVAALEAVNQIRNGKARR